MKSIIPPQKKLIKIPECPIVQPKSVHNHLNTQSHFSLQHIQTLTDFKKIIQEVIIEELTKMGIIPAHINKPISHVKKSVTIIPTKMRPLIKKVSPEINDDLMDIDLVRLKNSKDLLAIEGTVNNSKIQILVDTCANISFTSKKVCEELGIEIDLSKRHRITGASGLQETIGMARNVVISLATDCNIMEDFAVILDYSHREMILSRNCLKRYNYDIHKSRKHLAIVCNGKNFFIPIVSDCN